MDGRKLFTAIGAGSTSALLVAVAIIELLQTEFSAIVGLPVGLLVGVVVFVGLWRRGDELRLGIRRALTAYAAFGVAVLVLLAFRYATIGRSLLTVHRIVGVSLGFVGVLYAALFHYDRSRS